jgi:hypothetical protein
MPKRKTADVPTLPGGLFLRRNCAPQSRRPATKNARRRTENLVGKAMSANGATRLRRRSSQANPSFVDSGSALARPGLGRGIVRSGAAFCRSGTGRSKAMKAASPFVAALAVAILSIAPASAAPVNATGSCIGGCASSMKSGNAPWVGCSVSGGTHSPTCRNVGGWKTYAECAAAGLKIGWRGPDNSWYCTSLGLK